MATVPQTKATWTNGSDALDSTNLHAYLRDPLQFLMDRPAAELRQTSTQSLSTATWTAIQFQVEDLDDDPDGTGAHSTSVNNSRYTARYAGWYRCSGGVSFASNATGRRATRWAVNGAGINAGRTMEQNAGAADVQYATRTKLIYLNVGDYVELQGWQQSGGSLSTTASGDDQSSMTVVWERLA